MKCWIGKEVEGRKLGALTLFVRSLAVSADTLYWLKDECVKNGVNRLYFGAGRVPMFYLSRKVRKVFPADEYELVLECPVWQLWLQGAPKEFNKVVCSLRTRQKVEPFKIVPKVDTYEEVYMYDAGLPSVNKLAGLSRGLYKGVDKLITR